METLVRRVIALGMFDGMHMGHRALMSKAVQDARLCSAVPSVYTFYNHPGTVLGFSPKLLSSAEEKETLMRSCGANEVILERFTRETAGEEPEDFIRSLVRELNACGLVCGYNYTFGKKASGTPELLKELCGTYGLKLSVVGEVIIEGAPVSSTRIRGLIEDGRVEEASRLLGRYYQLTGTIIGNEHNGHKMGFPTANTNLLDLTDRVLPKDGVYATETVLGGRTYPCVTNIGFNPTVDGTERTMETHVLDFTGNLYGEKITVGFKKFLRSDRRFEDLDQLAEQISRDCEESKKLFESCTEK